jgi:isocitrate dehydrogenase (NAD+)
VTTPVGKGFKSVNVQLRQALNLYAAVRRCERAGRETRFDDVDIVVMRENTEGLYSGIENEVTRASYQPEGGRREGLHAHRPLRVPLRHPPAPREDHGVPQGQHHEADRRMFIRPPGDLRGGVPNIEYEEMIIDAGCMKLVQDPTRSTCC